MWGVARGRKIVMLCVQYPYSTIFITELEYFCSGLPFLSQCQGNTTYSSLTGRNTDSIYQSCALFYTYSIYCTIRHILKTVLSCGTNWRNRTMEKSLWLESEPNAVLFSLFLSLSHLYNGVWVVCRAVTILLQHNYVIMQFVLYNWMSEQNETLCKILMRFISFCFTLHGAIVFFFLSFLKYVFIVYHMAFLHHKTSILKCCCFFCPLFLGIKLERNTIVMKTGSWEIRIEHPVWKSPRLLFFDLSISVFIRNFSGRKFYLQQFN